ncbi:hypothetical protein Goarm_012079 [Gossypium armourianum]|uniref:Uncharacterized protein n=1 Tax=Gossypium armourianum TaxID=34283 RepID=A0A7J9IYS3_9ROSI|nr:hypothetical protein [Gossypium armourianum]
MMSTKLTYDDRIHIGCSSTRNISKYGKIGTIIYLLVNRLSFRSQRAIRITCHGLGSMASHICSRKRRGVGKSMPKGNDGAL